MDARRLAPNARGPSARSSRPEGDRKRPGPAPSPAIIRLKVAVPRPPTPRDRAWEGFRGEAWRTSIDPRSFIQDNYTPYEGDCAFLTGPTERTLAVWRRLEALFVEERRRGVYSVDASTPSSITAFPPGYIDAERELIVGLQTEAPLRRAIMPCGGLRAIEAGLQAYGYEVDPRVKEIFTRYRKTHNEAVFDAYTGEMRLARRSGIITGLPDAYGRGRIIGDYRRVALYGVDRLIESKQAERTSLDRVPSSMDVIRDREELAEQVRALGELKEMASAYGHDVSRPAATAREAIQWLYFGYLAACKEQNGAAMSLGRTSTFLDVFLERDIAAGRLDEQGAQELVDDFIIKLRIVRFLRTPEYERLFSGDPTWVTEAIGGIGCDGRPLVTRTSFRYLQTLNNLGPAPEPNMTVLWSPMLPDGFKKFCARVSLETSAVQYESDDRIRPYLGDDAAIACCVSAMRTGKDMQFFGARVNLAKALLYAINGGRDEMTGEQVAPVSDPIAGDVLDHERVAAAFNRTLDWLAGLYVNTLNVIHAMHDKYAYERIGMALHDHPVRRFMACGVAGLSVTADSLSAMKYATVKVLRDDKGLAVDYVVVGEFPAYGNNDDRADSIARRAGTLVHGKDRKACDIPRRRAHAVGADHHVERRVRPAHRQHARRPARRRALRARRQSDERARQARARAGGPLGREAPLRGRPRRHLAHEHRHARGARTHDRREGRESGGGPRRLRRMPAAST